MIILTDSVTPDQVNGIVNDLGNVLLNAASSTFGQNQRRKKGNSVNNKPWFNRGCKVKRDEFHNARKINASSKTPENKIKNIVLYWMQTTQNTQKNVQTNYDRYQKQTQKHFGKQYTNFLTEKKRRPVRWNWNFLWLLQKIKCRGWRC